MVKRKQTIPEEPKKPLNLLVPREEACERIQDRITKGESLLSLAIDSEEILETLREETQQWSDYNKDMLSKLFDSDGISQEYSAFRGGSFSMRPTFQQEIGYAHDRIKTSLTRLRSISGRLDLFDEPSLADISRGNNSQPTTITNRVFVVHGHDEALKQTVARMLGKLDLEPVILHEQPNSGRTIIEKLEEHTDVSFAVILLTPDDVGREKQSSGKLLDRARQNVILEHGYCLGKLGRGRVSAIFKAGVENPSDMSGVLYIEFDNAGHWKYALANEMKSAGLSIDLNKLV